MASTTSQPKKKNSSLKQSTLSFKTRKPGHASHSKVKSKAREQKRPKKSDSESEAEDDVPLAVQRSKSEDDEISANIEKKVQLDMQDRAGLYTKYHREVREKMGWMSPVHSEGQTKIHNMLRVFDNSYEYGPCIGLTRLQRWERAEMMGLNPPIEVRDILLTQQGGEDPSLVQNVFHTLV